MKDLDADEEEVDLAHHAVLEVELGLAVLELDVKAVLDAHLRRTQREGGRPDLPARGGKRVGVDGSPGGGRASILMGLLSSGAFWAATTHSGNSLTTVPA